MKTCSVCGTSLYRSSRQGLCRTHYLEQLHAGRKKFYCVKCGKVLPLGSKKARQCRECHRKEMSEKKTAHAQFLSETHPWVTCDICGRSFQSRVARYTRVRYCSHKCVSTARWRSAKWSDVKWTRDKVIEKVTAFLKKRGTYGEMVDLRHGMRISEKAVYGHGLSVPELNYMAGTGPKPACLYDIEEVKAQTMELLRTRGWMTTEEVFAALGIDVYVGRYLWNKHQVSVPDMCASLGIKKPPFHDKTKLEARIVAWIKEQGYYCDRSCIQRAFGLDFTSTWKALNMSAEDLNRRAGVRSLKKQSSSWYEDYAYHVLCKKFGERLVVRQKRFDDCRTVKGRPAKFDLYISSLNVLIEIDGSQHYEVSSTWYRPEAAENDRRKDAYAMRNRIPLYRLRVKEGDIPFEERLNDLIAWIE